MSEETTLIPIKTKEQIEQAIEFIESLAEVKFTNDEEYNNGVELCRSIKTKSKELEEKRKLLVKPLNDNVKSINAEFDIVKMLNEKERVIKSAMTRYYQEKERKRIEEQRKAEAEAEEKRRKELERAEQERLKAEKYRQLNRTDMADKAEARAETAQSVADTMVAPLIDNTVKVKGTSFQTVYRAELIEKKKAIEQCINNSILINYVMIDMKGIEKLAAAQKGNIKIEGIRIIEEQRASIRTK